MNPELYFQQWTVAMERAETTFIVTMIVIALVALAVNGFILYLTFGKVLIPLTRSVCNYLDAKSWAADHQYKPRPGHEPQSDSHYMPK
jgi:hypothetical protein